MVFVIMEWMNEGSSAGSRAGNERRQHYLPAMSILVPEGLFLLWLGVTVPWFGHIDDGSSGICFHTVRLGMIEPSSVAEAITSAVDSFRKRLAIRQSMPPVSQIRPE